MGTCNAAKPLLLPCRSADSIPPRYFSALYPINLVFPHGSTRKTLRLGDGARTMDPVCTLSLACNVIQVVSFGIKLVTSCQEIYVSGSLRSNAKIEYFAAGLQRICDELETETAANAPIDKDFKDLAIKCSATSRELLSKLDGIKMKSQKGKCKAIGGAIRAVIEKRAINHFQKQLDMYQKALETKMLKRLCDKFNLASLQLKHTFDTLDEDMQRIIQQLGDGHTRLEDLVCKQAESTRIHVKTEGRNTRACVGQESQLTRQIVCDKAEANRLDVANQFTMLKRTQADDNHLKAVMDSLFFPDIQSREQSIKDAHKDTFQWIFDTVTQKAQPWSNFPQWLQHDQGIYWIIGKADSGKSTLMNYLCAMEKTKEFLKIWAGNRKLLTPTFFFWNAGSMLQKSVCGLLRSLLYQILKHRPDLVSVVAENPIPTWTEKRLS